LVVVSIALRGQRPLTHNSEPLLTNATYSGNRSIGPLLPLNATALSEPLEVTAPWHESQELLMALAGALFACWLLSLLAFFRLCKRECRSSFFYPCAAPAYVKLRWESCLHEDKKLADKTKAALLVGYHPGLLDDIAVDARLWIDLNWKGWRDDKPDWLTDRWLRAVPSWILPQQVLTELGGKHRRRSTLKEQLQMLGSRQVADDAAVPAPLTTSTTLRANAILPDSVVVDAVEPLSDEEAVPSGSVAKDVHKDSNAASASESFAPDLLAVVPSVE
jgi:hypothetical protein